MQDDTFGIQVEPSQQHKLHQQYKEYETLFRAWRAVVIIAIISVAFVWSIVVLRTGFEHWVQLYALGAAMVWPPTLMARRYLRKLLECIKQLEAGRVKQPPS